MQLGALHAPEMLIGDVVFTQEAPDEDGLMKLLPYLRWRRAARYGVLHAVSYATHMLLQPYKLLSAILKSLQP